MMAVTVTMPKLGLTMEEGTIVEWRKRDGEEIQKGEILYVIETEKVTFEVEAPASGILGNIVAREGDVIPVGGAVAYILEAGEKLSDLPEMPAAREEAARPAGEVVTQRRVEIPKGIKISPVARKMAQENNIDVSSIKGTGPSGRIVREDVLAALEAQRDARPVPEAAAEEKIKPLSSMRKVIASRMTESFRSPHFYLTVSVDTLELAKARQNLLPVVEGKAGIRLTYTDLLVKLVARSLEDNPALNCAYADGSVRVFKRIDIGMVTAVEGGLVVPVIRQADKKTLSEISKDRAGLAEKAREMKLTREEMTNSTFTISNLGMFDIDQFSAILQPPEAAILAVGRIADRPVAREGQVVIRPMMTLTLSIDHRVLDGVLGANFLKSLKNYIENPDIASLAG
ncbi:MAG: dihydrolipoamide acetyltransferase family protein [Chloroflexota bacterium]